MNSASENSRLTNRNDQSCFSTRAFCATLLYSPREPSCWPHPWMISSTGPGSVLLVAPVWISSSSLPTPRFFFHLSFPPSCLLLFTKGSETPNFHRQKSLAFFLTSSFVIVPVRCLRKDVASHTKGCLIRLFFQSKSDML